MIVLDILRHKGTAVLTVTPGTTLRVLVGMLAEHRIGAMVVSADGATVDGIVSERDVVLALATRGPEALNETVGRVCTRDIVTTETTCRVADLMQVMTDGRFRHVPVVADGRLHGIVSIGDVVKSSISELQSEREALASYIMSG